MIFSILLSLLTSSVSFSSQVGTEAVAPCLNCSSSKAPKAVDNLEWWATTASQMYEATCRPPYRINRQDMLKHLQSIDIPGSEIDRTINAINFKNENPKLLQIFADIHAKEVSSIPDIKLSSKCDKVVCAMNDIYGDPQGIQLLYMMSKFGFTGSRLGRQTKDNYSPWKADELEEVIISLEAMPPSLFPIDYGKQLLHFKRGYKRAADKDGLTVANSMIEVFDNWNDLLRQDKIQTIVHELAHVIAHQENLQISPEWLKASGWEMRPGADKTDYANYSLKGSGVPSRYGKKSPSEDFAETLVAYRYSSAQLKRTSPSRYQYMKDKIFKGIEFLKEKNCSADFENFKKEQDARLKRNAEIKETLESNLEKSEPFIEMLKNKEKPLIALSTAQKDMIMKKCMSIYLSDIADGLMESSDSCIQAEVKKMNIAKHAADSNVVVMTDLVPKKALDEVKLSHKDVIDVHRHLSSTLSELFNESYKDAILLAGADSSKDCDNYADFYADKMPTQLGNITAVSDVQVVAQASGKILSRGCKIGLQDFGAKYLFREINPFARNPFKQIFR